MFDYRFLASCGKAEGDRAGLRATSTAGATRSRRRSPGWPEPKRLWVVEGASHLFPGYLDPFEARRPARPSPGCRRARPNTPGATGGACRTCRGGTAAGAGRRRRAGRGRARRRRRRSPARWSVLRRGLVPDADLVLAGGNALDREGARRLGLRVPGRVDDVDEAEHRRVDVAQQLHDARALERLRVRRPLLVEAGVEVVGLRQREDVVKDRDRRCGS